MADGSLLFDSKLSTSGFDTGSSKIASVAKTAFGAIGKSITAAAGIMAGFGAYSLKVGSSFEAGMSEVQAISGATGSALDALREKAKEMGSKTKFSATESAEAFKYMAMAGWDTEQMLGGIEGVMNLAAASGENLGQVSDIVTDAITAFGLEAKDAAHFADVLATASNSSNTNVGMMGATFKYVAPVAGALGYSIEDMSVAIGLMANAGIKGEQAGTQLRATISRLAKPTKESQEAMDKLGVSLTDTKGNMKPFNVVMGDMREGFKKLTKDEQASYAAMLGGQEAMSGLLAIANASDADFAKLTKAIQNADGAALEMAETMNDNLKGQLTIAKSAAEGLGIALYEHIQVPAKNAATQVGVYFSQITNAIKNQGLEAGISKIGNIFGQIAVKAAEAIPGMVNVAVNLVQSFVSGIYKNRHTLVKAALDIAKAIGTGLASFLPKEVQAPVKSAVEAIAKSFQSGGLKTAIKSVVSLFSEVAKVVGAIAKVTLPILTTAVNLAGGAFKTFLPLILAGVAAFKTFTIVSKVATMIAAMQKSVAAASAAQTIANTVNGKGTIITTAGAAAMAIKSAAAQFLTGKITLAAAAQQIWNNAIKANPIMWIVTGVAALAAGIIGLNASMNVSTESADRLAEANEKLDQAYDGAIDKIQSYKSRVSEAGTVLNDFSKGLVVNSDKQQELATKMESIESQITSITSTAVDERRSLTDGEIKRIDELMEQQRKLVEQQLGAEKSLMNATQQRAKSTATNTQINIEQYEKESLKIINSAQQTKDNLISLAEQQRDKELSILDQKFGDQANIENAKYKEEFDRTEAKYQKEVVSAEAHYKQINDTVADGYESRVFTEEGGIKKISDLLQQETNERTIHASNLEDIQNKTGLTYKEKNKLIEEENERHRKRVEEIGEQTYKDLDENSQNLISSWANVVGEQAKSNGKVTQQSKEFAQNMLDNLDGLPDDVRKILEEIARAPIEELDSASPKANQSSTNFSNSIIDPTKNIKPGIQQNTTGMYAPIEQEGYNALPGIQTVANLITDGAIQPTERIETEIPQNLDSAYTQGEEVMNGHVETSGAASQSVADGIKTPWDALSLSLPKATDTGLKSVTQTINKNAPVSKKASSSNATGIESQFNTMYGQVVGKVNTAFGAVPGTIGGYAGAAGAQSSGVKNSATSALDPMGQELKKTTAAAFVMMVAAITASSIGIALATAAISRSMTSSFSGLPGKMTTIIRNIFSPIAGVIYGYLGPVRAAVAAISAAVLSIPTKMFDIHSPSRVMKKLFGYVMDGAVLGISGGKKELLKNTEDVVGDVRSKFEQLSKEEQSGLMASMKSAVVSDLSKISLDVTGNANMKASKDTTALQTAGKVENNYYQFSAKRSRADEMREVQLKKKEMSFDY